MESELQKLHTRLSKIERELEKVRGCSPLTHGWQTQKYAKASRKWDMLAQEKREVLEKLEVLTNNQNEKGIGK
jgi:predicted secreted hydrolase